LFYEQELKALKRVGRFRKREIFDKKLIDLASNDYLGLSKVKNNLKLAYEIVQNETFFSPKASLLVNGYSKIHKSFEEILAEVNGFEDGVILGSGYLANIALVEALIRKRDILFIDEEFHSSGVLATKLVNSKVIWFKHNDPNDLREKLKKYSSSRNRVILVEGIYSMSGNLLNREIFDLADEFETILIVDEAHSSGVVGERLLGVYELYDIPIKPNHIKMGTLGKAYGSYGAYILASNHIITYLINRAKPIIYSTALSIFDTALAKVNFEYILQNYISLSSHIKRRKADIQKYFSKNIDSLILPIPFESDNRVKQLQKELIKKGFLVGAIRRPTVQKPILRVIPNLGVSDIEFEKFIDSCKELNII